jgi:hypothetical protein
LRVGELGHGGAIAMVGGYLKFHAHEDVINLEGGATRDTLYFSKPFGFESIKLYIVFKIP